MERLTRKVSVCNKSITNISQETFKGRSVRFLLFFRNVMNTNDKNEKMNTNNGQLNYPLFHRNIPELFFFYNPRMFHTLDFIILHFFIIFVYLCIFIYLLHSSDSMPIL